MLQLELQFVDKDERVCERIELAEVPEEVYEEMKDSGDLAKKVYFNYIDRMTFEEEWDTKQVNKHKDKIAIAFSHLGNKYIPIWAQVG